MLFHCLKSIGDIYFKLISIFFALFCLGASASSIYSSNPGKIPAAWVWEISDGRENFYLVGELHAFIDVREDDVDFSLGEYIFNNSKRVYIEPKFDMLGSARVKNKLSKTLNSDSWNKIIELIEESLKFLKKSEAQKATLRNKILAEIDDNNPVFADFNIRMMSYAKYIHAVKKRPALVLGLSNRLEGLDKRNVNNQKIYAMESESALENAWYQSCDDEETIQRYIDIALSLADPDYYWNSDKQKKIQKAFID